MKREGPLNIAIILNGISFYKHVLFKKFLPVLKQAHHIQVFETKSKHDGIHLASRCAERYKYDVILAAGGDGTLHQVVNGVLQGRESESKLPVIGAIPMGSGNDFAKTIGTTKDPSQLLALLNTFSTHEINIGKITYQDFSGTVSSRYFINVADIGMGPEVVKRVNESGRAFGSAVAYYRSIISTFFSYKPMLVDVKSAYWSWSGTLRTLAVGNGKYYGHGLCIAPDAALDDDKFNAFICGNVSVLDFIRNSPKMKKGKHVFLPEIHYKELTTKLEMTSKDACLVEGDGEILGTLPASIELVDRKIAFLMEKAGTHARPFR